MKENPTYVLHLFVADDAPNSARARNNLRLLCETYLTGCHKVEVTNVFKDPARALDEGIFMTPTLIKQLPLPVRRIVGTLSDTDLVREALGIEDDGHDIDRS